MWYSSLWVERHLASVEGSGEPDIDVVLEQRRVALHELNPNYLIGAEETSFVKANHQRK